MKVEVFDAQGKLVDTFPRTAAAVSAAWMVNAPEASASSPRRQRCI